MEAGKVQNRSMSTAKKVAIGTGIVAAGLTAAALVKGRKTDAFVKALENVTNNVEGAKKLNVFQTILEGYKAFGNKAVSMVEKYKQPAKEYVQKALNTAKDAGEKALDATKNAAQKAVNTAKDAAKSVADKFSKAE